MFRRFDNENTHGASVPAAFEARRFAVDAVSWSTRTPDADVRESHEDAGFMTRNGHGNDNATDANEYYATNANDLVPNFDDDFDTRNNYGPRMSQVAALPARTTPFPSIFHRVRVAEGIDVDVGPLDLEGEDLKDVLCVRMMEVVRILCHIKGDMLQALVDEMHQAMTKADTIMVLFARPLGALKKLPIQV